MAETLDLMSSEEMADPGVSARRMHEGERCPLYTKFDPNFYVVSRFQDMNDVLLNADDFLCGLGHGPKFEPPVGVVSDAPMHTFFRRLVQDDFKPGAIANLKLRLEVIANDLLDAVEGKGVWDMHDDMAFPLPVMIICEILGIPTDAIEQFKLWSDASIAALSASDPSEYADDLAAMERYVLELLRARRDDRDDNSLLARIAQARQDGAQITDEEAIGMTLQLFVAGNETTTSLITNFMWRMLSGEGLWADFCAGKIDMNRAINESLRYDPPLLGLYRTTARDVEIGDTRIPAHSKVLTHYGAANRDPAVFENPGLFDPNRPIRKIMSFALGVHFCLGAELAKLEAQVTLSALRNRCPNLQLVNDGERIGPFLFWGRHKLPVQNG